MEYQNLSIKNWLVEDRPREKLIKNGVSSLSDSEILAILISTGTKNLSAIELARNILHSYNNDLQELGKASLHDLIKLKGIGEAKGISILAAFELGRRKQNFAPGKKIKIGSSKDAYKIFKPLLEDLNHEEFWILMLNRSNTVIDKTRISTGGISGTVIDTRMILKNALDKLTSGLILFHNHPSGNITPSEADKKITEKIQSAASVMDISLLDHIIVGGNNYYSFADNGVL